MEESRKSKSRSRRGAAFAVFAVFLAASALLVGGLYYFVFRAAPKSKELVLTDVARRGPFEHVVLEQGEIESSKNVEIVCEVKSRNTAGTTIKWVIPEGTYVQKGDQLVELDSSALEQELRQQRNAVNSAMASKISAESALEQAKVAKEEYLKGTFAQEEKLILSEILVAEEKLSRAKETAKFSERLAALGFQTSLQLRADQFAVEQAQVELELAQGKLNTLREITKKKMTIQFDADIETARAQLEAAENIYKEEEEKLRDIEQQIAKCFITAPEAGVVIHANRTSSRGSAEFVVEAGATVREGQVIIRLPDPTKMQVRANINEARVPLVKEGMPVQIRVGAFEDAVLRGVVTKVNKYAEPTSWFSSQIKEYATYVQILSPPPGIRSGMTAEVRIFVDQRPSELQVPVQALYEYRGHMFCLVAKGDEYETREVKIGASNDKTVVILEGLQENEVVVLNPRTHENKLHLPDLPEPRDTAPEVPAEDAVANSAAAPRDSARRDTARQTASSRGGTARKSALDNTRAAQPAAAASAPSGGTEVAAAMWWSNYDSNRDGQLDAGEIAAVPSAVRDRIRKADTNGDGVLDRQELSASLGDGDAEPNASPTVAGGSG